MTCSNYSWTSTSAKERHPRLYDVMAFADVCADLIVTGNVRPRFKQVEQFVDYSLQIGGSGAIFAAQMARLGASTALLGWLGRDIFGEYVYTELKATGVDVTRLKLHREIQTCLGLALSEPNDRAILTHLGALNAATPNDLDPNLLQLCRHWHIAGYFLLPHLQPAWKTWLELCRANGVTTSLDTNWDPSEQWLGVTELLPLIDVFLPNEAEALAISKQSNVYAAAQTLADFGPLVVVKRGAQGALAINGSEMQALNASASPFRPAEIVDTTGAGDNFDAGFLHAWLCQEDIQTCLDLAHRCAVSSLEFPGGIAGQICASPELLEPEKVGSNRDDTLL